MGHLQEGKLVYFNTLVTHMCWYRLVFLDRLLLTILSAYNTLSIITIHTLKKISGNHYVSTLSPHEIMNNNIANYIPRA